MVFVDLKKIGEKLARFEESAAQVSILVITLILYLLTKNPIFGVLVAIELVAFVALEIFHGIRDHGMKHEAMDTLKSLAIALLIWLSISFLLRTAVPISAVVSCSMLPNMQRGDLVIIRGSAANELRAPEIEMDIEELRAVFGPETKVSSPYRNFTVNGSLFSYCSAYRLSDELCTSFHSGPGNFIEQRGPLSFSYSQCERRSFGSGAAEKTPCITSVSYKGKEYSTNLSNDIIVYEPSKGDLFSYTGDIIHRVFLRINVGSQAYLLTKGDNNNVFDIQFYEYSRKLANTPVPGKNVKGASIFAIPYVGYFKLFISGYVDEPAYCNSNLV